MAEPFAGIWQRSLSDERYITLPRPFAVALGEHPHLFRGPERTLYVVSAAGWSELVARRGHDGQGFHAVYGTSVRSVKLVTPSCPWHAPRLRIPKELRALAGIGYPCDVAVVGAGRGLILCEWEHWQGVTPYPARNLADLFGEPVPPLGDLLDLSLLTLEVR